MEYFRKTVSGAKLSDLFDLPLALRNKQVEIIVLPMENQAAEAPRRKLLFDFVKAAPLPERFFDPLPEEELSAWGI